jgi:hypothetical protein
MLADHFLFLVGVAFLVGFKHVLTIIIVGLVQLKIQIESSSILMLLCPIQHPVVRVPLTLEKVLQQPAQPGVVGLLLELKRLHVLEVLFELFWVR